MKRDPPPRRRQGPRPAELPRLAGELLGRVALAVVERLPKLDRHRGLGLLFGYPQHAIEFFLAAEAVDDLMSLYQPLCPATRQVWSARQVHLTMARAEGLLAQVQRAELLGVGALAGSLAGVAALGLGADPGSRSHPAAAPRAGPTGRAPLGRLAVRRGRWAAEFIAVGGSGR